MYICIKLSVGEILYALEHFSNQADFSWSKNLCEQLEYTICDGNFFFIKTPDCTDSHIILHANFHWASENVTTH